MSGEGVISVRLPRSVLSALQAAASRSGISVHEVACRILEGLDDLTDGELRELPEPPREPDNPRISLYVGWALAQMLEDIACASHLSSSSLLRRLLYGFLVSRSLQFVQQPGGKYARLVRVQKNAPSSSPQS